jgi:segregation and condensation protein B
VELKYIIEALLFAAHCPLTAKQLQQLFSDTNQPELTAIQTAIAAIQEDYRNRAVELQQVASGYRFQVKTDYAPWVARLFAEKPPKYSRALLETLAIIAYRQPVTRGDIEDIRGVSVSSNIVQTLLEREWIKVVGQKAVPGRPNLYGTTKQFLDYFNLSTLSELPSLQALQAIEEPLTDNPTAQANREQTSPQSETTA